MPLKWTSDLQISDWSSNMQISGSAVPHIESGKPDVQTNIFSFSNLCCQIFCLPSRCSCSWSNYNHQKVSQWSPVVAFHIMKGGWTTVTTLYTVFARKLRAEWSLLWWWWWWWFLWMWWWWLFWWWRLWRKLWLRRWCIFICHTHTQQYSDEDDYD